MADRGGAISRTDAGIAPNPAQLDLVFAALSDPIRRSILERLDGESLLVSEIAAAYAVSLQAISRHIQVLVHAGLITQARSGRISRGGRMDQPLQQILGCAVPDLGGSITGDRTAREINLVWLFQA
jgi:DNA-binding transcriptional ArsR family regulator